MSQKIKNNQIIVKAKQRFRHIGFFRIGDRNVFKFAAVIISKIPDASGNQGQTGVVFLFVQQKKIRQSVFKITFNDTVIGVGFPILFFQHIKWMNTDDSFLLLLTYFSPLANCHEITDNLMAIFRQYRFRMKLDAVNRVATVMQGHNGVILGASVHFKAVRQVFGTYNQRMIAGNIEIFRQGGKQQRMIVTDFRNLPGYKPPDYTQKNRNYPREDTF